MYKFWCLSLLLVVGCGARQRQTESQQEEAQQQENESEVIRSACSLPRVADFECSYSEDDCTLDWIALRMALAQWDIRECFPARGVFRVQARTTSEGIIRIVTIEPRQGINVECLESRISNHIFRPEIELNFSITNPIAYRPSI